MKSLLVLMKTNNGIKLMILYEDKYLNNTLNVNVIQIKN
jgi:hypothetical protein